MLSRIHRFHGHNSLSRVYRQGKAIRDPRVTLRYALNPKRKSFRAAVVVSRKVSKSAVIRNKIRRRIYEIIRPLDSRISDSYDLVFSVYSIEVALMPMNELRTLLEEQLLEAAVIKTNELARSGIVNNKKS